MCKYFPIRGNDLPILINTKNILIRADDAIHLASLKIFKKETGDSFSLITSDRRLSEISEKEGFQKFF
ncbi:MAG: hypothetical protein AB1410_10930 [Acidobacteriota bacterium]